MKNKTRKTDLAGMTERAVELAKGRRARVLDADELEAVQGGKSIDKANVLSNIGRLEGYAPRDLDVLVGIKTTML